jgi:hypothetical protein
VHVAIEKERETETETGTATETETKTESKGDSHARVPTGQLRLIRAPPGALNPNQTLTKP